MAQAVDGQVGTTEWVTAHNRDIGFNGDAGAAFDTVNGIQTFTSMGTALVGVGWPGPFYADSIITAYKHTTGGDVTPHGKSPAGVEPPPPKATAPTGATPGLPAGPAAPGAVGAFHFTTWLSASTTAQGALFNGIPNWIVVAIPSFLLLERRR